MEDREDFEREIRTMADLEVPQEVCEERGGVWVADGDTSVCEWPEYDRDCDKDKDREEVEDQETEEEREVQTRSRTRVAKAPPSRVTRTPTEGTDPSVPVRDGAPGRPNFKPAEARQSHGWTSPAPPSSQDG